MKHRNIKIEKTNEEVNIFEAYTTDNYHVEFNYVVSDKNNIASMFVQPINGGSHTRYRMPVNNCLTIMGKIEQMDVKQAHNAGLIASAIINM